MSSDPRKQRCVVVTGPRGAGKTRLIQRCILRLLEQRPETVCAVVLAEEGRTRMEGFMAARPGFALRKLFLPCFCCPGRSNLAGELRALVEKVSPDWTFIEMPAIAAVGLMPELDGTVGPGSLVVVCLSEAWAAAQRENMMMPFQTALIAAASAVITGSDDAERLIDQLAAGTLPCATL